MEAFGAKADGVTFSGDAFAAAITACSNAGGGTVHARGGGAYIVGGVQLKSHVTLSIATNSSVLGTSLRSINDLICTLHVTLTT